jgi:hypothetical protein
VGGPAADGEEAMPQARWTETGVIDEVIELLRREETAMAMVESRLRAIELLAAAGQERFVATALDELDAASERLAGLELGRVLALAGAGLPPDLPAARLPEALDVEAERLQPVLDDLARAATRLTEARDRAWTMVSSGAREVSERLEASGVLASA